MCISAISDLDECLLFPARQGSHKLRDFLEVLLFHVRKWWHLRRANRFSGQHAIANVLEVAQFQIPHHALAETTLAVVVATNAVVALKHLSALRVQCGRSGQVLRFTVTACKSQYEYGNQ
jgi:hypothetical protein